jgi:hypothetical protein
MTSAAKIPPALATVYRSGAVGTHQELVELVDQFKRDAMAIDPSITGIWMFTDQTIPDLPHGLVQGLYIEREHAPLHVGAKGGA